MRFKHTSLLILGLILAGCQGMPSEKPPIHINPNMDWQPKFKAQDKNTFFEDNRGMRTPVEGTVARGLLNDDAAYYQGVTESGAYVAKAPVELTRAFLYRGKERYEIFCQPCHGATGAGDGIVVRSGLVPPPSFHDATVKAMPDGQIYSAIYNGVRTMSSYRTQIPAEDRWAIVSYIRALQRSQSATATDLQTLNLAAGN
jgi:mono/diheme cytochrome c family protein